MKRVRDLETLGWNNFFEQAFEQEKKRKDMLEKKFREAQKQTEGDDSPPPKPFDFD